MALLLSCQLLASCVYDDVEADVEPADENEVILSFALRMSPQDGTLGEYRDGNFNENYIDLDGGNYRIYFFDMSNRYIAGFIPTVINTVNETIYNEYSVWGNVPQNVAKLTEFKVVMLANWDRYDDTSLQEGVTTIEDLCSAENAQYSFNSLFIPGIDRGIPMFGVHEYHNVTFEKGKRTELSAPITLLRAMAKVEVILENDDVSLTDVSIHGYNKKGYCAPSGVYSQNNYDHNGDWNADYVSQPHLVGGANEMNSINNKGSFYCSNRRIGTTPETWVAYLPEYLNSAYEKASIELRFDFQSDDEEPCRIYFTRYNDDGIPIDNTDFNILRNYYYSFTVNVDRQGGLQFNATIQDMEKGGDYGFDY